MCQPWQNSKPSEEMKSIVQDKSDIEIKYCSTNRMCWDPDRLLSDKTACEVVAKGTLLEKDDSNLINHMQIITKTCLRIIQSYNYICLSTTSTSVRMSNNKNQILNNQHQSNSDVSALSFLLKFLPSAVAQVVYCIANIAFTFGHRLFTPYLQQVFIIA